MIDVSVTSQFERNGVQKRGAEMGCRRGAKTRGKILGLSENTLCMHDGSMECLY